MSSAQSGHASVRDPEYPNTFWVNPFGLSYGREPARGAVPECWQ